MGLAYIECPDNLEPVKRSDPLPRTAGETAMRGHTPQHTSRIQRPWRSHQHQHQRHCHSRLLLGNLFLGPCFLEAEEPGKVGAQLFEQVSELISAKYWNSKGEEVDSFEDSKK